MFSETFLKKLVKKIFDRARNEKLAEAQERLSSAKSTKFSPRVAVETARSALAEILKFLCSGGYYVYVDTLWKLNGVRW